MSRFDVVELVHVAMKAVGEQQPIANATPARHTDYELAPGDIPVGGAAVE